ncbi:hypothetical protein [Amycolatopsis sp. NPDC059657]|uniref:hypothetical protein n=1 Tax=Amycolatopsis sp. NPDC059657 TaxID=3346899 RepID=UPI00366C44AC
MTTDAWFDDLRVEDLRAGFGVKRGRVGEDVLPTWVRLADAGSRVSVRVSR